MKCCWVVLLSTLALSSAESLENPIRNAILISTADSSSAIPKNCSVLKDASNNSGQIIKGCLAPAFGVALADGPEPGPADVVAGGILVGGAAIAGVTFAVIVSQYAFKKYWPQIQTQLSSLPQLLAPVVNGNVGLTDRDLIGIHTINEVFDPDDYMLTWAVTPFISNNCQDPPEDPNRMASGIMIITNPNEPPPMNIATMGFFRSFQMKALSIIDFILMETSRPYRAMDLVARENRLREIWNMKMEQFLNKKNLDKKDCWKSLWPESRILRKLIFRRSMSTWDRWRNEFSDWWGTFSVGKDF